MKPGGESLLYREYLQYLPKLIPPIILAIIKKPFISFYPRESPSRLHQLGALLQRAL